MCRIVFIMSNKRSCDRVPIYNMNILLQSCRIKTLRCNLTTNEMFTLVNS